MKSVVFDIGNVIFYWNPEPVLKEFFQNTDMDYFTLRNGPFREYWLDLDRGKVTEETIVQAISEETGVSAEQCRTLMDRLRHALILNRDTLQLIHRLKSKKIQLTCLSNISYSFWNYLKDHYSLWSLFDDLIISAEVHLIKPDPAIFHLLIQRLDVNADDIVFIDDRPENVESAASTGINTIQFVNTRQCSSELKTFGVFD